MAALVLGEVEVDRDRLRGFELVGQEELDGPVREYLRRWREELDRDIESMGGMLARLEDYDSDRAALESRIGDLRRLDFGRIYVCRPTEREEITAAVVSGLAIEPGSTLAAALTLVPPNDARPGDAYRFDVMQRDGKRIVGGSTYVLVEPDQGSGSLEIAVTVGAALLTLIPIAAARSEWRRRRLLATS